MRHDMTRLDYWTEVATEFWPATGTLNQGWFDITLRLTRVGANLVSLGTAHGNPLKILLTEELDEATAKGPQTPRPERARR